MNEADAHAVRNALKQSDDRDACAAFERIMDRLENIASILRDHAQLETVQRAKNMDERSIEFGRSEAYREIERLVGIKAPR